jgi:hypothetical protein
MSKITKISYAKPDDHIFKEKFKTFTPLNKDFKKKKTKEEKKDKK